MKLSKEQIVNGITEYFKMEVIRNIPDAGLKVIVGAGLFAICNSPDLLNRYLFDNVIVTATKTADGKYDLDGLIEATKSSIKEYGNLTVTIPAVPLISKEDKTLSFSSMDIGMLKEYLERSAN